MPRRAVSGSDEMLHASILLETHTHTNRGCAFCGGACCLWEVVEGWERILSLYGLSQNKNGTTLKLHVERSRHEKSAWWALWSLLGMSNLQEPVRNPVSKQLCLSEY